VAALDNRTIAFDMKGKTKPGWLYSIGLPPGAVVDMSGNYFVGLSGGKYTFRIASASFRTAVSDGGGNTGFLVGLSIGLVVASMCIATLVWKFQSVCYAEQRYKRQESRKVGPVPVPVRQGTSLHQVEPVHYSGPSIGAPAPVNVPVGSFHGGPVQNNGPERSQSSPANERSSWARAGSSAPKPERTYSETVRPEQVRPERVHTENGATFAAEPRKASSHPSHSRPPPGPPPERSERRSSTASESRSGSKDKGPSARAEPTAKTATPPVVENTCPEARGVEKQMRTMMNEPLAVRKKMIKDLMLEHHPDKNAGSESAKEVFQFINAARGWFLHDT